jgi:hypothetical protein
MSKLIEIIENTYGLILKYTKELENLDKLEYKDIIHELNIDEKIIKLKKEKEDKKKALQAKIKEKDKIVKQKYSKETKFLNRYIYGDPEWIIYARKGFPHLYTFKEKYEKEISNLGEKIINCINTRNNLFHNIQSIIQQISINTNNILNGVNYLIKITNSRIDLSNLKINLKELNDWNQELLSNIEKIKKKEAIQTQRNLADEYIDEINENIKVIIEHIKGNFRGHYISTKHKLEEIEKIIKEIDQEDHFFTNEFEIYGKTFELWATKRAKNLINKFDLKEKIKDRLGKLIYFGIGLLNNFGEDSPDEITPNKKWRIFNNIIRGEIEKGERIFYTIQSNMVIIGDAFTTSKKDDEYSQACKLIRERKYSIKKEEPLNFFLKPIKI